jgi:hypothetical protein
MTWHRKWILKGASLIASRGFGQLLALELVGDAAQYPAASNALAARFRL